MKIAVHYSEPIRGDNYAHKWIEYLEKNDVEVVKFDYKHDDVLEVVKDCDGVMWHWNHHPDDKQSVLKILMTIENIMNIPVFPDLKTRWHFDEKVGQHYLLRALEVPAIKSWVFWDYQEALDFINEADYPLVFKLSVGAGSSNVLKVDNYDRARALVDSMFNEGIVPYTLNEYAKKISLPGVKERVRESVRYLLGKDFPQLPWNYRGDYYEVQKNYVYFQEYLPDNDHDIRITVIGERAFGYIRHNRPGDFRASGSGNFDPAKKNIPIEAVELAHKVSKKGNFQSMAYDILVDPSGKYRINEISYCYVNHLIEDCPGYWDRELKFHKQKMWPEEAHVIDFLNQITSQ